MAKQETEEDILAGMAAAHEAWKTKPRTSVHPARLVDELRALFPHFKLGGPYRATVDAGDGQELEIEVHVRRRVPREDLSRYRNAALERLASERPMRDCFPRLRCDLYTRKEGKGAFARGGSRCACRPVGAIVLAPGHVHPGMRLRTGEERIYFGCGRHLPAHGFDPAYVLAVVDIAAAELEGAWQRGRDRYEERRRAIKAAGVNLADLTEGSAPQGIALPPACRRCGTDQWCTTCSFDEPPRSSP